MKYLSKKKQQEVRMLAEKIIFVLPLHIKDIEVVGSLYDKLSLIVKATHSREEYLEWLMEQVRNDVDYKYSKEG